MKRSAIPAEFRKHAGRERGTYVVVTRNNAWGRGTTLEEAFANARAAGGKNLTPRNVAIAWQPDSAWESVVEIRKGEGKSHDDVGRPFVNGYTGAVLGWGGEIERLHSPDDPVPTQLSREKLSSLLVEATELLRAVRWFDDGEGSYCVCCRAARDTGCEFDCDLDRILRGGQ